MPSFQTSAYIQSREATLGETMPRGHRQFFIPLNQRPFVWSRHQIDGLWRDFERQINAQFEPIHGQNLWVEKKSMDSMPHFLGNFIFVQRNSTDIRQLDEVEVFDGQQRITAISMLASCLLDHAEALRQRDGSPAIALTWSRLMNWVFSDPRAGTPRVVPDPAFQSLFYALIVKHRSLAAREMALKQLAIDFTDNPDHKTLYDRFKELHTLVLNRINGLKAAEIPFYIDAASEVLSRFLLCIETTVPVEAFGLRVFSSLNTAATPLSAVDNLKNQFFDQISKQHHATISTTWRSLIQSLGAVSPKEFFRRRLLSLGNDCPNDDKGLFRRSALELEAKTEPELLNHLSLLAGEATIINKIRGSSAFNALTNRYLADIYSVLGASIADIVLLAAYRKFMPSSGADFEASARLVRNFLLRELTIGQRDTASVEKNLIAAAKDVAVGGLPLLSGALQKTSNSYIFFRNFSERTEVRPKIQFYILFSIEEYLCRSQGLQPFPHSLRQHIEHIVPQKIDKLMPTGLAAWPYWKDRRRALHERYLNRLGNLLLLEADINTSVKNRSFTEKLTGIHQLRRGSTKKRGYSDSSLRMPKKLAKSVAASFEKDDIDRRQRVLAKLALKVWSLG